MTKTSRKSKVFIIFLLLVLAILTLCIGLLASCVKQEQPDYSYKGPQTASCNDISMDYFCFGHGDKTMVILPGISITSVMPAYESVQKQYSQFSEKYKVYLFDRKKDMDDNYSTEEMAEDTYQIMKSLGIDSADFFGVSQGGCITLSIAAQHPDIAHSVCLCSSTNKATEQFKQKLNHALELANKGDVPGLNTYFSSLLYSTEFYNKHKEQLEKNKNVGTPTDLARFSAQTKAQIDFNMEEQMDKIKCPVYIIASKNDKLVDVENAYNMINSLHCNYFIFDNYGHAVYDEAPDALNKCFEFFEKN